MTRSHLTRFLPAALTIGLVAVLWAALAPPQLGGRTMLATSYGSSMQPMIHRGDVIVLRKGGPAKVGDVVGYRSAILGKLVVHRVHRIEGGKLVLKGDNNDFLDPDRVPQSAVVGHLAYHVPQAGFVVEELRKPQSAAGLGVIAAIFLLGGTTKRRRRMEQEPVEGTGPSAAVVWHGRALWTVGGIALVSVTVALPGLTRAPQVDTRVPAFSESGVFSYRAAGAGVYESGVARTGDPVFLAATDAVDVSFAYDRSAGELAGSATLVAEVVSTAGWKRTFPLGRPVEVDRSGTVTGTLDLQRLRTILDRLEARTGVIGAPYDVRVRARVRLLGSIGGTDMRQFWAPAYRFLLDATTLKPADRRTVFARTREVTRTVANDVALGPVSPSVTALRSLGAAGLALALVLLAAVAVAERRTRSPGEAAAIERRLRRGMLTVETIEVSETVAVVELASIDELVSVAQEYERLVLHQQRGDTHSYSVLEDGTVYRYELAA